MIVIFMKITLGMMMGLGKRSYSDKMSERGTFFQYFVKSTQSEFRLSNLENYSRLGDETG